MPSRTTLVPMLLLAAAVAATGLLLIGEDLGLSGIGGALHPGDEYVPPGLREADGPRLVPRRGGPRADPTKEEEAAARAAAPTFPRALGVFGRVVDGRDKPIPRATVKLILPEPGRRARSGAPDPPPIATTTTDAEGNYVVGPGPEGALRVRAEAAGYAPSVAAVKRRGYRVDLVLDSGGALEVTVKDGEGKVLEAAHVVHQADQVVTDDVTDASGRVLFPGLPTGTGTLYVTAEGHASIRQRDVALTPGETEHRTVVLSPPTVIEGRVIDDESERAVGGATLTFSYPYSPWMDATEPATTDADGAYEATVSAPLGESVEAEVRADGYPPARKYVQLRDAGGGRMRHEIRLTSTESAVSGKVVAADGSAAAGVRVVASLGRSGRDRPETKTAEDGHFALSLSQVGVTAGRSFQLVATSETDGVAVAWARIPKEGGEAPPVELELTGAGRVTGKVASPDGEPASGALVQLTLDWTKAREMARQGRRFNWALWQVLQNSSFVAIEAVTDADGSYTIPGVPAASFLVTATYGLDTVTADEGVTVTAGGSVVRNVTLGEGRTIEGTVLDENGRSVPGAYVRAWEASGRRQDPFSGGGTSRSARSQSDGRFVIHSIPAGTYSLRASASGYQSSTVANILDGTTGVELTLRPLGWIEGEVQHGGRPFAGTFVVKARRVRDGRRDPRSMIRGGRESSFSTDDGRFLLRNLRAGPYDVSIQTPDGLTGTSPRVEVQDGLATRVRVALVGGAVVTGVLLDDRLSSPIASASITIGPAPAVTGRLPTMRTQTDSEGHFQVRGLPEGNYVVTVYPPSQVGFHTALELRQGEERHLQLRERSPGSVRTRVRDPNGEPVSSARVQIDTAEGPQVWPSWTRLRREGLAVGRRGWQQVLSTDDSGVNLRRYVPPGRHRVSARRPGYELVEAVWIEVESDRTTNLELVLKKRNGGEAGEPVR